MGKIFYRRPSLANTLTLGYSWFGICFKEPMLDAYQNITNRKIEHLECFEALSSFDSFTKVVSLIQGADDSHIRDRSFEWLKRRYRFSERESPLRCDSIPFRGGMRVRSDTEYH